jgi:hypothetical protein
MRHLSIYLGTVREAMGSWQSRDKQSVGMVNAIREVAKSGLMPGFIIEADATIVLLLGRR